MSHPFNRYRNYEYESNQYTYEYERRQYEREEAYWHHISRENDRDYFGDREEEDYE